MKKCVLLLFFFMPICMFFYGQEKTIPFWGEQNVYLANQTEITFQLVEFLLSENPPSVKEPSSVRKAALLLLDGIFHDTRLDSTKILSQFMESRLNGVLEDMKKPVTEGTKVYKLYNDGFIIKTKSVTVAFDLYRGGVMKESPSLISDEMMLALVRECDIMFISHNHPDHTDPGVVKMFTDAGKQVIAPDNSLKGNEPVTHIRSEKIIDKTFKVKGGKLDVKILPGHQSELINNIYVVTSPEGLNFAHTGDQYSKDDLKWLLDVQKKIPALDILLINCWANRLSDTINGFNPKVVITGHENELGHSLDHREAYWLSYVKLEDVKKPNILMTWGECFWYRK